MYLLTRLNLLHRAARAAREATHRSPVFYNTDKLRKAVGRLVKPVAELSSGVAGQVAPDEVGLLQRSLGSAMFSTAVLVGLSRGDTSRDWVRAEILIEACVATGESDKPEVADLVAIALNRWKGGTGEAQRTSTKADTVWKERNRELIVGVARLTLANLKAPVWQGAMLLKTIDEKPPSEFGELSRSDPRNHRPDRQGRRRRIHRLERLISEITKNPKWPQLEIRKQSRR
jgi:hypothetical protein